MKQNIYKNAGFPPIKYCSKNEITKTTKEKFYSPNSNNEINIRQLLYVNKKPLIIDNNDNNLEVIDEL
jgi:hypothetical protein